MHKTLLVAIVACILSGCASSGRIGELPTIEAGNPSSQLILIRVSSIVGAANSYYIALDGKDVFSIRSGEYTQFPIPTGEHVIAVKCFGGWSPTWKADSKKFKALPDQPVYFEISPNMTCAEIIQIAADAGTAALTKSAFVSPDSFVVVIDQTEQAYTVYAAIPSGRTEFVKNKLDGKPAEVVSFEQFVKDSKKYIGDRMIRNDYPEGKTEEGVVALIKKYPGTPFGVTWNGGIAFTRNDYEAAKRALESFKAQGEFTKPPPEKDPVSPMNNLKLLLGW